MKLKPLGDRLIVRAVEEEEVTPGGIVVPETSTALPRRGRVMAVGQGKLLDQIAEGDEILYSKYGGTEITVEGVDLLVLRESDVLAHVGVGASGTSGYSDIAFADDGPGDAVRNLATELEPQVAVEHPALLRHAMRNAEARAALVREFGAVSRLELESLIAHRTVPAAAVDEWLADGALFAVEYRGVEIFPGFEFEADGSPLPIVKEVTRALTLDGDRDVSAWEVALWFTSRTGWLGDERPVDLLNTAPEQVVMAARHERESVG
jgi:chaperonin GroES